MKKESLLVSFLSELSDIENQLSILIHIGGQEDSDSVMALSEISLDNLSQKLDRLSFILIKLSEEYKNVIFTDSSGKEVKATDYLAGLISVTLFKTLSKIVTTVNSDLMLNTAILSKLSSKDGMESKQRLLLDLLTK